MRYAVMEVLLIEYQSDCISLYRKEKLYSIYMEYNLLYLSFFLCSVVVNYFQLRAVLADVPPIWSLRDFLDCLYTFLCWQARRTGGTAQAHGRS